MQLNVLDKRFNHHKGYNCTRLRCALVLTPKKKGCALACVRVALFAFECHMAGYEEETLSVWDVLGVNCLSQVLVHDI